MSTEPNMNINPCLCLLNPRLSRLDSGRMGSLLRAGPSLCGFDGMLFLHLLRKLSDTEKVVHLLKREALSIRDQEV